MFRFTKNQRLLAKKDYDHVFEQAKKITTTDFIVLFRANNKNRARLGLALSKKMIMKAHDRNRIKRLLRENFRHLSLPPIDIIFLAKKGISKHTNKELISQLSTIWVKIP